MAQNSLLKKILSAESRTIFILGLILFVLPTGNPYLINPLLLTLLLNSLISLGWRDWLGALKNPVFLLPAIFYLYYTSTIFWSEHTADALLQLETKLTLFAATLVIAANKRHLLNAKQYTYKTLFIAGNVLTMLYAFGNAFYRAYNSGSYYNVNEAGERGANFFIYTELSADIMHVGYLSTYVGVALLLSLYNTFWGNVTRVRWGFVSAFLLISLVMLQGRINVLAFLLVIGIVALAFAIKNKAYKWLAVPLVPGVLLALFVAFGPQSLTKRFVQVPDINYDITAPAEAFNSATYRLAEWKGATRVIKDHPIFGTGVGDNRVALQDAYSALGFNVGLERHYNAHNQYLETTIASGAIGLVFLLAMLVGYLYLAYKRQDYVLLVGLLYFMLCMLTESMFERAWAVIFYAVFFSTMLLVSAHGATNKRA